MSINPNQRILPSIPLPRFCLWILFFLTVMTGCGGNEATEGITVWGFRGGVPGRFSWPRAIAVYNRFVYVIDRSGRLQKFTQDGTFVLQWQFENPQFGTPTGITVDESGNLWIPDTHNSRIFHFNGDGVLLSQFGEGGKEPGKFILPTDLVIGDQGELFIAEYGNYDRIQVFTQEGVYLRGWGEFGEVIDNYDTPDNYFNRPMAIAKGIDGNLYIADSANHRIKVYTQSGELVKIFGRKGTEPGEFQFPYDIGVDDKGNLYICEFGNHRVQVFSPDGTVLRVIGELGEGIGQLYEPWGIDVNKEHIFVADTHNHRIQIFPL